MGGRAKLGAFVMTLTGALVVLLAVVGLTRREQVLELAVDPSQLLIATAIIVALALAWIAIIISSHRLLRPASTSGGGRALGSAFVGLLCFAIAAPMAFAAQSVLAQRDLIGSVFQAEGKSKSATRPKVENKKDPWASTPRLNILLLGADDGTGRDGTRTDTVMVASIDTKTGDTSLISLSRNWMRMPFPEDSPLHEEYPDGYWDPNGEAEQPEYYLDAMYRNIPEQHPGILGESDNEGADVLKVSVGAALGLDIDYYMQVNLKGFETIVDALGGIKVNINYKVPVGGDYKGEGSADDVLPRYYLTPGANKKLMGPEALWFARGRYGLSDTSRQERQRCTIKAIVDSAQPATLVTKYQQIASASKKLLRTDIPQEILPAFIELGMKVKSAKVTNVDLDKAKNFPNGRNPDYEAIAELVAKATKPKVKPISATTAPPKTTTTTTTGKPSTTITPKPGAEQDLADVCAYNPVNDEE
ncbi:LCP family protein [Kribbella sp. NBC_01245]|uniref:LCP family protein n=1 Tax=Kribbella sp. NBC_01245 TaxID=2903578 RepID=UPI002E2B18B9|nr:LCP family protein [Kribbella sp. NBC_01245]